MAKKQSTPKNSLAAEEKQWKIQRNAQILKDAAMMSASDKKAAQSYLQKEMNAMQMACGGKLK